MSTDKKNNTSKNILAIVFSVIILFFFITIAERAVRSAVLNQDLSEQTAAEKNDALNTNNDTPNPNAPDWEKLYPHEADEQNLNSDAEQNTTENETTNKQYEIVLSVIDSVKEKIDYYTSYLVVGRLKIVELNAKINNILGLTITAEKDGIFFMKNGYLTINFLRQNMSKHTELIKDFNEKLQKKGIDFLYVQIPSKEYKYNNMLPHGLEDNANANSDELIQNLAKANINHIDIREVIHNQKIDHYSLFFKTDLHWKPEAGLWATKVIAEKINETTDFEIDTSIFNESNFNFKIYEDFSLGSQGKCLTLSCVDPEDFTLITPKIKTNFTVDYYNSYLGEKQGSFEQTMIDNGCFKKKDYYNSSQYSSYLFGVQTVVSITNNLIDNDYHIVYITDSFSSTVVPFLSMGVKRIDKIDNRSFVGNIEAYIEKNKPDLVIVAYSATVISQGDINAILDFS